MQGIRTHAIQPPINVSSSHSPTLTLIMYNACLRWQYSCMPGICTHAIMLPFFLAFSSQALTVVLPQACLQWWYSCKPGVSMHAVRLHFYFALQPHECSFDFELVYSYDSHAFVALLHMQWCLLSTLCSLYLIQFDYSGKTVMWHPYFALQPQHFGFAHQQKSKQSIIIFFLQLQGKMWTQTLLEPSQKISLCNPDPSGKMGMWQPYFVQCTLHNDVAHQRWLQVCILQCKLYFNRLCMRL